MYQCQKSPLICILICTPSGPSKATHHGAFHDMLSHIIKICLTFQIVTNCRKFQADMLFTCVSLHFNLHIITFLLHISLHIIKSNASDFTHHATYHVPSTYQSTYQSYRTYRYTYQIHIPLNIS